MLCHAASNLGSTPGSANIRRDNEFDVEEAVVADTIKRERERDQSMM